MGVIKKRWVLDFPKEVVEQPITYKLIKEYNLKINILRAKVTPEEEGRLMIEVEALQEDIQNAESFLRDLNIKITPLAQEIELIGERCVHCGYCIPYCPVGALYWGKDLKINLDKEKCVFCEACFELCPYKAIEIKF